MIRLKQKLVTECAQGLVSKKLGSPSSKTPFFLTLCASMIGQRLVNEPSYKIDRMLNQLKLSGMLSGLAGMILGAFEGCHASAASLSLSSIFHEYFFGTSYPVIRGFPTGHSHDQIILPLQCVARVDTYANRVSLLELAMRNSFTAPYY